MKKQRLNMRIICSVLLCLLLFPMLSGCSRILHGEKITIYPCYFNRDVEGMDAKVMGDILTQAGYTYRGSTPSDDYTAYVYRAPDFSDENNRFIFVFEYTSAEAAKQAYIQDGSLDFIIASDLFIDRENYVTRLRISNCVITAMGNAHVELLSLLDLGTVQPLEATERPSSEMYRDCETVNIEKIKVAMEEDGYQFYAAGFLQPNDEEDGYTQAYLIVSPEQDRMYAFTGQGEKPKGTPSAYSDVVFFHRLQDELFNGIVGVHVVGFEDGSNIICYGESFEEIKAYFTEE